jgi:hypothetical protein
MAVLRTRSYLLVSSGRARVSSTRGLSQTESGGPGGPEPLPPGWARFGAGEHRRGGGDARRAGPNIAAAAAARGISLAYSCVHTALLALLLACSCEGPSCPRRRRPGKRARPRSKASKDPARRRPAQPAQKIRSAPAGSYSRSVLPKGSLVRNTGALEACDVTRQSGGGRSRRARAPPPRSRPCSGCPRPTTVRARRGRSSALCVFRCKSVFYGAFCLGAQGA